MSHKTNPLPGVYVIRYKYIQTILTNVYNLYLVQYDGKDHVCF